MNASRQKRGVNPSASRATRGIEAWTDYPIVAAGDLPGKLAPIRLVQVLSYDRNLYCRVRAAETLVLIKRGYLYKQRGRVGKAQPLSLRQLKRLPLTRYGEDPA